MNSTARVLWLRPIPSRVLWAASILTIQLACQSVPSSSGSQARRGSSDAGFEVVWVRDGRARQVRVVGLDADGLRWRAEGDDAAAVEVAPWSQLLAVHGSHDAARVAARTVASGPQDARVRLVGGALLCGELLGGDPDGEGFELASPVFGRLTVPIDRLARIEFPARAGEAGPRDFVVPADVDDSEAVFYPARRGFDRSLGAIQRFVSGGVLFSAGGLDAEPREWRFRELAAIAVRDGFEADEALPLRLTTRAGDVVQVAPLRGDERIAVFALEGGEEVTLEHGDITSLTPVDRADRDYLSDLEPVEIECRSWFSDAPPLRTPRIDAAVHGGPLIAGGRGYGKGLGVASRTRLVFEVPEDAVALVGAVALDDSVLGLGLRAAVDVRVRVAGREVLAFDQLRAGEVRSLGRVAVEAGQRIELLVDFGAGYDLGDRVDWLDVAFVAAEASRAP